MPITREHEKHLTSELKLIIKLIIKQYKFINKCIEEKNFYKLSKVLSTNIEISSKADYAFELSVENYSFAPLGKDLRRNVSYSVIIRILKDISNNLKNLVKFLQNSSQYKGINNKWVIELSNKIISRLIDLDKLMTSENSNKSVDLIERDESFNLAYKNELKQVNKRLNSDKVSLSQKEKDEIIQRFILAIKSFELTADGIKKIAEMTLYISTGKLF